MQNVDLGQELRFGEFVVKRCSKKLATCWKAAVLENGAVRAMPCVPCRVVPCRAVPCILYWKSHLSAVSGRTYTHTAMAMAYGHGQRPASLGEAGPG